MISYSSNSKPILLNYCSNFQVVDLSYFTADDCDLTIISGTATVAAGKTTIFIAQLLAAFCTNSKYTAAAALAAADSRNLTWNPPRTLTLGWTGQDL